MQDYDSESVYYNRDTNSYCYVGTNEPNHDSVIIGWDDDYPKKISIWIWRVTEHLSVPTAGEKTLAMKAILCVYYDTNIGVHNIVYTGAESAGLYEKIYQSDLCGWVGQIGYGQDTVWATNTFRAGEKEELEAAGFYATGPDTGMKCIWPDICRKYRRGFPGLKRKPERPYGSGFE